jgi:hypothetical protein
MSLSPLAHEWEAMNGWVETAATSLTAWSEAWDTSMTIPSALASFTACRPFSVRP